jgi:SET domain-containing protein
MGLAVRTSTIPNSGKGLFVTKDFGTGKRLCKYVGEKISDATLKERYGNEMAPYVLYLSSTNLVDARSTQSCIARYINSATKPGQISRKTNARLLASGWVVSTRNIKKGEEILMAYGKAYWNKKIKRL